MPDACAKVTTAAGVSQKKRTLLLTMNILLAAATAAEITPTVAWLQESRIATDVSVLTTGVGMMATAFTLTQALFAKNYDLVIGAGIAGAFEPSISLGECVLVEDEQLG